MKKLIHRGHDWPVLPLRSLFLFPKQLHNDLVANENASTPTTHKTLKNQQK
jgi:hypothetical protein